MVNAVTICLLYYIIYLPTFISLYTIYYFKYIGAIDKRRIIVSDWYVLIRQQYRIMDDVTFTNSSNSDFFVTDDDVHRSSSKIADTLDLAVCQPATMVHLRSLEQLTGRWTFLSMPQDVNLTAYGKQFSDEWPSFRVEVDCDVLSQAKDFATEETLDGRTQSSRGSDAKESTAPSGPNKFVRQCVAYIGRLFTLDFYRAVCLYFLPIVTFRNRGRSTYTNARWWFRCVGIVRLLITWPWIMMVIFILNGLHCVCMTFESLTHYHSIFTYRLKVPANVKAFVEIEFLFIDHHFICTTLIAKTF